MPAGSSVRDRTVTSVRVSQRLIPQRSAADLWLRAASGPTGKYGGEVPALASEQLVTDRVDAAVYSMQTTGLEVSSRERTHRPQATASCAVVTRPY